jgi:hypothetical protein
VPLISARLFRGWLEELRELTEYRGILPSADYRNFVVIALSFTPGLQPGGEST